MEALADRAAEAREALRDGGLLLLHGGDHDDPHWFTDNESHASGIAHAFEGEVRQYRVKARRVHIMDRDERDERLSTGWEAEDDLQDIMDDEELDAIILPGWEYDDEITVLVSDYATVRREEG